MIVYATSSQERTKSCPLTRKQTRKSLNTLDEFTSLTHIERVKNDGTKPSHRHGTHIFQKIDGILLYRYHDTDYLSGL